MNQENQKPEVVVVTGAAAGLGRAIAQAFARRGAHIGLLARSEEQLRGALEEVESLGGQGLILPVDVADAEAVEAAAAQVEETFGPIDIWVNDAMTSVFAPFAEMTAADYKRVTEVSYLGYVYGTMAALKRMRRRDRGMIVQVGSALAYRGIPLQSAYCGAKHAIQGFTESLRCELIHDESRVRITMVQMPALNTTQFGWVKNRLPHKAQPVPPIYQPEVGAEAVYWAAHHYTREVNVGGSTTIVIWGNKFLPGLGDWYLGKTGFASQQTSEPANPRQPNDLWQPVPGGARAHGTFDARASSQSYQLWATTQGRWITRAAAGLAALLGALLLRRSG